MFLILIRKSQTSPRDSSICILPPLHPLHEFSRLDFSIKPKEPRDTSSSYYYKACLLQPLLIHSAPKCKPWVAPRGVQCPPPQTVNICGSHTAISLICAVLAVVYLKVLVVFNSCDPMDCSPPGSSVHGISLAMKQVAIPFSRASSPPRDRTQVSHIAGRFFTFESTRKP